MSLPALLKSLLLQTRPRAVARLSIGEQVRANQAYAVEYWQAAKTMSNEYCAALDMSKKDIEDLEHFSRYLVVSTRHGEIQLVPKNTCGCPYGDTWVEMLQARLPRETLSGIGGGTTFFSILPEHLHEAVLEAIRNQNVDIRQGRIRP